MKNPNLTHILNNPNAYSISSGDYFGYSVAISPNGNYAIVGAYGEDDASGFSSGKAYIFDPATGQLLWILDNPNPYSTSTMDYFGYAVAISNNYAIVGAFWEDDAGGSDSGKAYIFDPVTGALLWTLDNPNAYSTSYEDYFGNAVAISDNYAIVGAWGEDSSITLQSSGKVYIFDPATGQRLRTISDPNAYSTSHLDSFGSAVAISDSYLIASAPRETTGYTTDSGRVYIFDPFTGQLLWTLSNPNASTGDYFGSTVAISDNWAIVGTPNEDETGGIDSGKVYIFNAGTGQLVWTLNNPNAYSTSAGDNFGRSVAISDNYLIIGANGESDAGGTSSGKAYIFDPSTGALLWTLDNINAYSTSAGDSFGYSVAISNNYAIVGAQYEDDAGGGSSGKTYIYNITDITTIVMKNSDVPNKEPTTTQLALGELAINTYDGQIFIKKDNGSESIIKMIPVVNSVNGVTSGDVILTSTDVQEGSRLYFTTSRVRNTLNATGNLTYNSSTGELEYNKPSPTITLSGDVTGTCTLPGLLDGTLNGTIPSSYSNVIVVPDTASFPAPITGTMVYVTGSNELYARTNTYWKNIPLSALPPPTQFLIQWNDTANTAISSYYSFVTIDTTNKRYVTANGTGTFSKLTAFSEDNGLLWTKTFYCPYDGTVSFHVMCPQIYNNEFTFGMVHYYANQTSKYVTRYVTANFDGNITMIKEITASGPRYISEILRDDDGNYYISNYDGIRWYLTKMSPDWVEIWSYESRLSFARMVFGPISGDIYLGGIGATSQKACLFRFKKDGTVVHRTTSSHTTGFYSLAVRDIVVDGTETNAYLLLRTDATTSGTANTDTIRVLQYPCDGWLSGATTVKAAITRFSTSSVSYDLSAAGLVLDKYNPQNLLVAFRRSDISTNMYVASIDTSTMAFLTTGPRRVIGTLGTGGIAQHPDGSLLTTFKSSLGSGFAKVGIDLNSGFWTTLYSTTTTGLYNNLGQYNTTTFLNSTSTYNLEESIDSNFDIGSPGLESWSTKTQGSVYYLSNSNYSSAYYRLP